MADADEYESLPESTPLMISSLAGATAGIAEHCIMYPLDSVKTRMQSLMCERQHNGIVKVFRSMVAEEGLLRPMRGMTAMAAGAGPAHALYFTAIEKTKHFLTNNGIMPDVLAGGTSAIAATMLHDGVMTPAEVVKQRMQMCCSPFKTCTSAVMTIYKNEGLSAFYRSYATQLTMNIPFQAAVVSSYSFCQNVMNPEKEYSPLVHFAAGAIAGGIGSAVTMPLDVCKTLLNTQESAVLARIHTTKVVGLLGAAQIVHRVTGVSGFFQGLSARVLYQAPSTAVAWSVYEFFKFLLISRNAEKAPVDYDTIQELQKRLPVEQEQNDPNAQHPQHYHLPHLPEMRRQFPIVSAEEPVKGDNSGGSKVKISPQ